MRLLNYSENKMPSISAPYENVKGAENGSVSELDKHFMEG